MPTAEQFRAAARSARAAATAADGAEQLIDECQRDTGLQGGRAMLTVDEALMTSRYQASVIGDDCRRLADELDARAVVCDEHVRTLRAHDWAVRDWRRAYENWVSDPAAHRAPGPQPRRPDPPAHWVEPK